MAKSNISLLSKLINNSSQIMPMAAPVSTLASSVDTITDEISDIKEELRKTRLEISILQLLSGELITVQEFKSLTKMRNSVDKENWTVAEETVKNLMNGL
jgi:hypothetical protein